MATAEPRKMEILLVEDNPADQKMVLKALEKSDRINIPHVVSNGEAAIDYLKKSGDYKDVSSPDLILLDLGLPRKSGKEFLAEIKDDLNFRSIPVVVLTSSRSPSEVKACYELGAACYLEKKADVEEYMILLQSMENLFFSWSSLSTQSLPMDFGNSLKADFGPNANLGSQLGSDRHLKN